MFVFSGLNFYAYNFTEIYYKAKTAKFFQICSTLFFWANFMLFVSFILGFTGFDGSMIAYILGVPLIFFIMFYNRKTRFNTLLSAQNKFNNGEELQSHLRYVLQLIHTQAIDRNSYMMLIGYVETHKENCDEDDCPLKMKKSSKKKKKKTNVSSKLQPNSKNYNGFSK